MKKIKVNLYKEAKTLIILNAKIAFIDSYNNNLGFWFNNEIKILGKQATESVNISQQVNFIMISFNFSWRLEEFIESLDKNVYDLKEFK